MKPQFSLAHLTILGCPPPEMIYIASMAGYDFASPRFIYMGLPGEPNYALAENPQMFRETRTALRETGLKLNDIELGRVHDGLDPKKYLPAMEIGAELGAKALICSFWTPNRSFAIECYAQLCDQAKPLGMTVDLEFPTWSSMPTLKEAVAVLNTVKRPNMGILVDTLHFHRSRITFEELEAVPRDWFHFTHICDAPPEIPTTKEGLIHTGRDERLYVGEGGIDIAGILKRIPEVPHSIELPHLLRVKEFGPAEHARRCLVTAKRYLEAHPRS